MLAAALLIVSLTACNKDNNPVSPGPANELLPLAVGNRWVYSDTVLDSNGTTISTSTDTMLVLRDTVLQNQTWFTTTSGIYRDSSNGLWIWSGGPQLVFKYPASAGDSFSTPNAVVTVVSTNEHIDVPYGGLLCYHYRARYPAFGNLELNDFVTPGIGFVSLEGGTGVYGGKYYVYVRRTLRSFTLH